MRTKSKEPIYAPFRQPKGPEGVGFLAMPRLRALHGKPSVEEVLEARKAEADKEKFRLAEEEREKRRKAKEKPRSKEKSQSNENDFSRSSSNTNSRNPSREGSREPSPTRLPAPGQYPTLALAHKIHFSPFILCVLNIF
jgi:hypothetical protein